MTQYSTWTPGLVASIFTPFLQERGSDTSENTSSRSFFE